MSGPGAGVNVPHGAVAVGIDVGGTKIAGGVVDLRTGAVRHAVTVPTDLAARGSDAARRTTVDLARQLVQASEGDGSRPAAVGIGVPELVAPDGTITSAHLLPWDRDVLAAELAAATGVAAGQRRGAAEPAVRIESDVRCAALAEARFGAGRPYGLFVYLTVGTGIAFSLVRDGVPYTGAHGHAHLLLAPPDAPAPSNDLAPSEPTHDAGAPGEGEQPPLLEAVAAGPALVRRFRAAGGRCGDDAREVLAAAAGGDGSALAVLRDAGAAVGEGLAVLVNAFDPEAVVVGGGLGLAGGPYWDCALDRARRRIWAPRSRDLPIVRAGLGVDAGVVGAALAATSGPTSPGGTRP